MGQLTRHVEQRMRQRGVKLAAMALVLDRGDQNVCVRSGCMCVWLSRLGGRELVLEGHPLSAVEQALKLEVIIDPNTENVITVFRSPGRAGHRRPEKFQRRRSMLAA